MTSYSFKVELDDVDIWYLESLLKDDLEKIFQEHPEYKKLSEQGSLLRAEKILLKFKEAIRSGLKSIYLDETIDQENKDG